MKLKKILKNAGVFLIAVTMVLLTTVVTASFTNIMKADGSLDDIGGFEKIVPPEVGGEFGYSVCGMVDEMQIPLSFIGAPYYENGRGAVYVYEYYSQTEEWMEKELLIADDGQPGDSFGYSVCHFMTPEGQPYPFCIIGAPGDDNNKGAVYVFEYDSQVAGWMQKAKLLAADGVSGDKFGCSICGMTYDIPETKSIIGIGAWGDDDKGADSGSAYVFEYYPESGEWEQKSKITADDGQPGDLFGYSLCGFPEIIPLGEDDATHIMMGAPGDDNYKGSAYIFEYDQETGGCTQKAKLFADDGASGDKFGVSICGIKDEIAIPLSIIGIGAWGDDDKGADSGSAYVFEYNQETEECTQKAKLLAPDGAFGAAFGYSLCAFPEIIPLGEDDATALIFGAPGDDSHRGAAYVFIYDSTNGVWDQPAKLIAPDGAIEDKFGYSIYIQPVKEPITIQSIIIGAPGVDNHKGAVYVYTNNPPDEPTIDGETKGKAGTEYTYTCITEDPDNDKMRYYFDWGDGDFTLSDVTDAEHVWGEDGTYIIKCKAIDQWGAGSDWGTLSVSMPKSKTINAPFFLQRLIHRFPLFEKILNQIV